MITKLTLRNFKSVGVQVYEFTRFDLLVGRNNSGKSTVLQAMAIWQFRIDEFHRSKRTGTTGIQIVRPNFTALPVPEFILLWQDRTDRRYPKDTANKKKPQGLLQDDGRRWQEEHEGARRRALQGPAPDRRDPRRRARVHRQDARDDRRRAEGSWQAIITPTSLTITQLFGSTNEQYVIPTCQRRDSWHERQVWGLADAIPLIDEVDTHLLRTHRLAGRGITRRG